MQRTCRDTELTPGTSTGNSYDNMESQRERPNKIEGTDIVQSRCPACCSTTGDSTKETYVSAKACGTLGMSSCT